METPSATTVVNGARWPDPTDLDRRARALLADRCWQEVRRAEAHGDALAEARYLDLLRGYDDGRYQDLIEGTGTLELETDPAKARVRICGPRPTDGRWTWRSLGSTPLGPLDLCPGRHLLEIRQPGRVTARRLLTLPRGADLRVRVELFTHDQVGQNHRVILSEGGTGGSISVRETPITNGEYWVFLDSIAETNPGLAMRGAPLMVSKTERRAPRKDPDSPVLGVPYEGAVAYCAWLTRRSGEAHRLPRRAELDRAFSGAHPGAPSMFGVVPPPVGVEESIADDPKPCGVFRTVRDLPVGGGQRLTLPPVPCLIQQKAPGPVEDRAAI